MEGGSQAEEGKKEAVVEQPKEEEGNKDPGGAVGTTSAPGHPEKESSQEHSQQVQNGT